LIFFIKNIPILKDIIPDNYIDIHSHLLPGIDDGSKSIEDTIVIIEEMKKIGVSEFITTPHVMNSVWNNSKTDIESKLNFTQNKLKEHGITNTFKAAAEYMLDNSFVAQFEQEPLLTLKENYVLVEMSYLNPPMNLFDILFELQVAGYQPILAHPERYNFYHHSHNAYKRLKTAGCKFQLNALSCVGYYGPEVAKAADFLLKNGMIDFAGTDIHHKKHIEFFSKKIVLKNHICLNEIFQNNTFFKS